MAATTTSGRSWWDDMAGIGDDDVPDDGRLVREPCLQRRPAGASEREPPGRAEHDHWHLRTGRDVTWNCSSMGIDLRMPQTDPAPHRRAPKTQRTLTLGGLNRALRGDHSRGRAARAG